MATVLPKYSVDACSPMLAGEHFSPDKFEDALFKAPADFPPGTSHFDVGAQDRKAAGHESFHFRRAAESSTCAFCSFFKSPRLA